jgi:hypothetical protein
LLFWFIIAYLVLIGMGNREIISMICVPT